MGLTEKLNILSGAMFAAGVASMLSSVYTLNVNNFIMGVGLTTGSSFVYASIDLNDVYAHRCNIEKREKEIGPDYVFLKK